MGEPRGGQEFEGEDSRGCSVGWSLVHIFWSCYIPQCFGILGTCSLAAFAKSLCRFVNPSQYLGLSGQASDECPQGIMVICSTIISYDAHHADGVPCATTAGSSFSQGFRLFGFSACVPCPSKTVFGISLMPGIGCPVVMSSTMCANEVGYGAGGSLGFVGAGIMPLGASKVDSLKSSGCTPCV